jgi:hypothetical protein
VRCAIRIAFESDSGHSDDWPVGKPFFQFVVDGYLLDSGDHNL